ncbi:hypothetical protein HBI13_023520 [Parastagonospora nodorum]|nr:hypothetical protein HBI10_040070 [Parastagonospora nodorum]KAH4030684.1 hypothetical protein HBI13_023520 [Parastagonospora nodorum]KAH4818989.1 hypothetical protein HBH61_035160 [Parastagonospora nodorum]KAH5438104.1 hypothetical protein HBI47_060240 [Parastagonospora nodorum]
MHFNWLESEMGVLYWKRRRMLGSYLRYHGWLVEDVTILLRFSSLTCLPYTAHHPYSSGAFPCSWRFTAKFVFTLPVALLEHPNFHFRLYSDHVTLTHSPNIVQLPTTEDFYTVLGVTCNATPEAIVRSYRKLALKLHPDRNPGPHATQAFQLLGRAYETLKDEAKRRAYDILYPAVRNQYASTESRREAQPSAASSSQTQELSEAAQVAVLNKSNQERTELLQTKKRELDATIAGIVIQFREAEEDINAAIRSDELTIRVIKNNIRAREFRMRQEKARVEREQRAEFLRWQQAEQERRDREAMKAWEKDQAAIRVARKQKDRAWQASLEKQRVEQEMRARILREQQEEQQRRSRQAADARLVAEYQRQAVAHVAQRQRQEDFNSQHPGSRTFQSLFCLHGCSFRELLGYAYNDAVSLLSEDENSKL